MMDPDKNKARKTRKKIEKRSRVQGRQDDDGNGDSSMGVGMRNEGILVNPYLNPIQLQQLSMMFAYMDIFGDPFATNSRFPPNGMAQQIQPLWQQQQVLFSPEAPQFQGIAPPMLAETATVLNQQQQVHEPCTLEDLIAQEHEVAQEISSIPRKWSPLPASTPQAPGSMLGYIEGTLTKPRATSRPWDDSSFDATPIPTYHSKSSASCTNKPKTFSSVTDNQKSVLYPAAKLPERSTKVSVVNAGEGLLTISKLKGTAIDESNTETNKSLGQVLRASIANKRRKAAYTKKDVTTESLALRTTSNVDTKEETIVPPVQNPASLNISTKEPQLRCYNCDESAGYRLPHGTMHCFYGCGHCGAMEGEHGEKGHLTFLCPRMEEIKNNRIQRELIEEEAMKHRELIERKSSEAVRRREQALKTRNRNPPVNVSDPDVNRRYQGRHQAAETNDRDSSSNSRKTTSKDKYLRSTRNNETELKRFRVNTDLSSRNHYTRYRSNRRSSPEHLQTILHARDTYGRGQGQGRHKYRDRSSFGRLNDDRRSASPRRN